MSSLHKSDLQVRIDELNIHPIKSCAAVAVRESLLIETGFEFDRCWMVVDADGSFVTQRELPRMTLVRPTMRASDMVLRAPGMLALHILLDTVEEPTRVRVWNDEVAAYDMGDLAAQWFSDFLGRSLRLVRFDPDQKRLSSRQWTRDIEAENAFSDGYPVLVASTAGLDELNRRLATGGSQPVTMQRFRPNIVLGGLEANGEDHLDEIRFDTPSGPVQLKLVKPCSRCSMPDVDLQTAEVGHAVSDALAGYRSDACLDGAITFGMNAVIVEGCDRILAVGMEGAATYKFD